MNVSTSSIKMVDNETVYRLYWSATWLTQHDENPLEIKCLYNVIFFPLYNLVVKYGGSSWVNVNEEESSVWTEKEILRQIPESV